MKTKTNTKTKTKTKVKATEALRTMALARPGVDEGVACKGTPLEKRTFRAQKKAFLFLGMKDAMVKLSDSVPEATKLAAKHPARYKIGAHGWATAVFPEDDAPLDLLERWIDESYRVVTTPAVKQAKKKTTAKKKTIKTKSKKTKKKKSAGRR